jgi:hypothetical protein
VGRAYEHHGDIMTIIIILIIAFIEKLLKKLTVCEKLKNLFCATVKVLCIFINCRNSRMGFN